MVLQNIILVVINNNLSIKTVNLPILDIINATVMTSL
jgi:hypothetical protein